MPKRVSMRFLLTYMMFFLCLLLVLLPAYKKTMEIFTNNILQGGYDQMVDGITALETDIQDITTLAQSFYTSTRFSSLSYLHAPYSANEAYAMAQAGLELARYMRTLSIIKDMGIVYANGIVLTPRRVYTSMEGFYGPFFQHGTLPATEWLTRLRSTSYDGLLAAEKHYSYEFGTYYAITLSRTLPLTSTTGAKTILFANISVEDVMEKIVKRETLGKGFLALYDCTGRLLMQSGQAVDDIPKIDLLTYQSNVTGIRVELGLPRSLVIEKLKPLTQLYWLYGMLVAGIGLMLSLVFANRNSKPVRDIVRLIEDKDLPPHMADGAQEEFGFIKASIHHYSRSLTQAQDRLEMQDQIIRSNTALRLIHGLIYTDEAWREARNMFPNFPAVYRLCHVRTVGQGANTGGNGAEITELLRQCFPGALVLPLSDTEHVVSLAVQDIEESTERIRRLIDELRKALFDYPGVDTRYAVSDTHRSIEELSGAYAQTAHILRLCGVDETHAVCFREDLPQGTDWAALDLADTERFYRLLLAGEQEGVMAFIDKTCQAIKSCGYADSLYVQQAYVSLLLVLNRIHREFLRAHLPPFDFSAYSSQASVDELFGEIRAASLSVCHFFEHAACKQSQTLTARILQYIDANLSNPGMHARAVATQFSMTESALQKVIRAATDKTFFEYLDGRRMELAVDLLKNSTLSVQEKAAKTGFLSHNSFYKAFRRSQGIPPSALRT